MKFEIIDQEIYPEKEIIGDIETATGYVDGWITIKVEKYFLDKNEVEKFIELNKSKICDFINGVEKNSIVFKEYKAMLSDCKYYYITIDFTAKFDW